MPQAPKRIVPDKGIEVPKAKREELSQTTTNLATQIENLQTSLSPELLPYLPDVQIFYNALHYALEQDIFFEESDIEMAETLASKGTERANQLAEGTAPWKHETGLTVRGYISDLDGSIQPYGLIVPDSFNPMAQTKHRLDIWHHGRNNKLSEVRFLTDRLNKPGEFTPADTFVLHTYGRYCNAMKFAGEVDTFEALAHAKEHYPIDDDRVLVRGFSMGGAATWHQAVHYTDQWVAATPGAGFAETPVYQNALAKEPKPPVWEQTLWKLYDATAYAGNLRQCPTIAYSGEEDKQKQASDIMEEYMNKEGLDLPHVIGPGMGHKYHPDSKVEIEAWLSKVVANGRNNSPNTMRFTTYTLRYNKMFWVTLDTLEKHWQRAQFNADVTDQNGLQIVTENINAFSIDQDTCPVNIEQTSTITIDGQTISYANHYEKYQGAWKTRGDNTLAPLTKQHGLQGPIDDAFMESFLIVSPTGQPCLNETITDWIASHHDDAIYQWQMQFRGTPRAKTDIEVDDEDIQKHNLILWGDPSSNSVLAKISDQLPIKWAADQITVGNRIFSAEQHIPTFIFPNPLSPNHYVVINSGFTFAPQGASSNANQTPKLPDWAILDVTKSDEDPAHVVTADFFDELWQIT